jgi:hypothetical protein
LLRLLDCFTESRFTKSACRFYLAPQLATQNNQDSCQGQRTVAKQRKAKQSLTHRPDSTVSYLNPNPPQQKRTNTVRGITPLL